LIEDKNMSSCIIICNGKSLNNVPREFLKLFPTFGTNRIYMLDGGFTPTYYVCVNENVLSQYQDDIEKLECIKFLPMKWCKTDYDHAISFTDEHIFSRDCDEKPVWQGHTVTYVCLQLAYRMRFRTVFLVGLDHSYEFQGKPDQVLISEGKDQNHFDPDYFADGAKWQAPNLEMSEKAYQMAEDVFRSENKRIINLTPGSKLDVFEKGDVYYLKDYGKTSGLERPVRNTNVVWADERGAIGSYDLETRRKSWIK
jgi:hypothetical protein